MSQDFKLDFLDYLRAQDRSENTIRFYGQDLAAFDRWFQQTNGGPMTPERVTALDVREYKSFLQNARRQKPATVNRKLASLKTFLAGPPDRNGYRATQPQASDRHARPRALHDGLNAGNSGTWYAS